MEQAAETRMITLSMAELRAMRQESAEIGARMALEKIEKEKKKAQKQMNDKRLHNTKLLLKNYKMLKLNAENSIFGQSQMKESAADILNNMMSLYDDGVIVDSIKRSATRTAIIVSHIEEMLEIYKIYCDKAGQIEQRRYQVLYDMYISDEDSSVQEIAKLQKMSKESVYSDLKISIKRLTALIFGIDSLNQK